MCGIAGAVGRGLDFELGGRGAACMRHRGPDDNGVWTHGDASWGVALASTRLSILDLSPAGHMPMSGEDGHVTLVYNGEIYNHAGIRSQLEAAGHQYHSRTDTETVVHAFEEYGVDCFRQFDGMYATAIYDTRRDELVVARDRMGIKPLYYWWSGTAFYFASELKALLAIAPLPRRIDRQALDLYLTVGYVPAPFALIEGVRKLLPGHTMSVGRDGPRPPKPFWEPRPVRTGGRRTAADLQQATREAVTGAVRSQLIADVPVGVMLSGGLDSTIVAAVAQRDHSDPVDTYSVGFDPGGENGQLRDFYNLDLQHARQAAQELGTHHHEVIIGPDEVAAELPGLVRALDEPVWEGSFVSIYRVAKLARSNGTEVLLTGDAADELFGGYPWYPAAQRQEAFERVPMLPTLLPLLVRAGGASSLGVKARDYAQWIGQSAAEKYRLNHQMFTPEQRTTLVGGDDRAMNGLNELLRPVMEWTEGLPYADRLSVADLRLWVSEHFNQRVDRMTMATSLEARVPFQANDVVDLALSIPMKQRLEGGPKHLLRSAFADIVPAPVLNRPKRPFAMPEVDWLWTTAAGRGLVDQLVSEDSALAGVLDMEQVRQFVPREGPVVMRSNHRLWCLLNLELWCRAYLGETCHPSFEAGSSSSRS